MTIRYEAERSVNLNNDHPNYQPILHVVRSDAAEPSSYELIVRSFLARVSGSVERGDATYGAKCRKLGLIVSRHGRAL